MFFLPQLPRMLFRDENFQGCKTFVKVYNKKFRILWMCLQVYLVLLFINKHLSSGADTPRPTLSFIFLELSSSSNCSSFHKIDLFKLQIQSTYVQLLSKTIDHMCSCQGLEFPWNILKFPVAKFFAFHSKNFVWFEFLCKKEYGSFLMNIGFNSAAVGQFSSIVRLRVWIMLHKYYFKFVHQIYFFGKKICTSRDSNGPTIRLHTQFG